MSEKQEIVQDHNSEGHTAHYANCIEELTALIKGRVPIIWVVTHEETRFIQDFVEGVANPTKRQTFLWSSYQGLLRYGQENAISRATGEDKDTWNPQRGLQRIVEMTVPKEQRGHVYILRDFHTVLGEPIPRQMRDMYEHLITNKKTLIVTSPILAHGPGGTKNGLPPTLEKQVHVTYYDLPTKEQIESRMRNVLELMKQNSEGKPRKATLDYTDAQYNTCSRALQGLTLLEVEHAISTSLTHLKRLDSEKLIQDKRQIVRKSEILEFIETPMGLNEIGGLDLVKDYLTKYTAAHSKEALAFGVEPLKGILLTGVPGTGKSALAKAIGKLWEVPLLRLDVGKVMTGLVGGSEGKMREVINQAEAMAPCVLWIDEVEKSLSGTKSSNFSDGGTLSRVFGTLLTAMQDGMKGVTMIATANDITMLPPEFIRRFNEVFFVDLPGPEERWEIFAIHLKKRGRNISLLAKDKGPILDSCKDYTGAEIEKAIKDAIAHAFYDNKGDIQAKHVIAALKETKPIAKIMKDKINKIREKAKGQYRFASSWAEKENKSAAAVKTASGKKLDIDSAVSDFKEIKSTNKKTEEFNEKKIERFSDEDLLGEE